MENNGLNTKAMLVTLSISYWYARKYDKKESKKLTDKHSVTEKAARVTKNLFPVESESYQAIVSAHGAARQEHYRLTLPWTDGGSRILLANNYEKYTEAMRPKRSDFDTSWHTFVGEYPALYESAKINLKTLWKQEDYPSASDMPNKFSFSIKVLPLPEADDFRVSLGADDIEAIKDQIRDDTKASIAEAMKDPYDRLFKVVFKMAEKLHDRKGIFHDSLLGNIEDLIDLLPSLNLTQDPKLIEMGEQIRAALTSYEPETLRKNNKVRKNVAEKADQICNDLAGFMGGGNG